MHTPVKDKYTSLAKSVMQASGVKLSEVSQPPKGTGQKVKPVIK